MIVGVIAGQSLARFIDRMLRKQCDAVIGLLSVNMDVVAAILKLACRKFLIDAFDFLKDADIRLRLFDPFENARQAGVDRIYIETGYLHDLSPDER